MKKLSVFGAALALCVTATAQQTILSPSEELKLDITDAGASIAKVANKIKPLAKRLDDSAADVMEAINAVQDDPNALNKARFEKVLASHMRPVMLNMELVLANELEMECALADISTEVKRVALRLRQDYKRTATQNEELRDQLKDMAKQLQKKAAEVKASGARPDENASLELRRLNQRFTLAEQRYKMTDHLLKQLQAGMNSLNRSSENMAIAAGNMNVWFQHLRASRDNFRTMIRMRRDMANIAQLGSTASRLGLGQLMSSFNKAMRQINQVGDLMSRMGSSVESLEQFNQEVAFDFSAMSEDELASQDVSALADQILERDYSFLDRATPQPE